MRAILTFSILALTLWSAAPAAAGRWCLHDSRGGVNCGFETFEQCRANQAGIGGSCQRNLDEPDRPPAGVPVEAVRPARPAGSWCLHDSRGGVNCGFRSFEQCMANRAGIGGSCQRNTN